MSKPSLHPDLYRRNGFRVTALPVDATARTMRRRRRETNLDGAAPGDGPLPLDHPPTPSELNDAFARLEDPRSRIVDELLWVWTPADGRLPPGVGAATARAHDDAVLAHCRALDLEASTTDLSDAQRRERDERWGTAMRSWRAVLADDDVWQHLHRRRAELADPRLSGRDVDQLRIGFPNALLEINAELALSGHGDDGTPARHRRLMTEFADTSDVDRVLRGAAGGLVGQVEEAVAVARDGARPDAPAGRRLIERTAGPIATLQSILPHGDSLLTRAQDAVATTIRQIAVRVFNEAQKVEPLDVPQIIAAAKSALELLGSARTLVRSTQERAAIDRDIATCTETRDVMTRLERELAPTPPAPPRTTTRPVRPTTVRPSRPTTTTPAAGPTRPPTTSTRPVRPRSTPTTSPSARPPTIPPQRRPSEPTRSPAGRSWVVRRLWSVLGGIVAAVGALTGNWGTWSFFGVLGAAGYVLLIVAGVSAARLSRSRRRGEALTLIAAAAVQVLTFDPYPTLVAIAIATWAGFIYSRVSSDGLLCRVVSLWAGGIACLLVSTIWLGSTWLGALGVLVFASGWVMVALDTAAELRGGLTLGAVGLVAGSAWIWWGGGVAFLLTGLTLLVGGGLLASEEALRRTRSRAIVIALLGVVGVVGGVVLEAWWLWVPGALVALGSAVVAVRNPY